MVTAKEVYALLPKVDNRSKLTKANQSTSDIINQVLSQHKANQAQAKKIAHLFDRGDAYSTAQYIWTFLKNEIPYAVEPSDRQSTKTLSRIVYDAMHGERNDCKHYAGFTGAILDALGYQFKYRFAGYSQYINVPTHVYCVAKDNKGDIVIDAVLNGFDIEKPYKLKVDKNMSLYMLSGIDDDAEIGGLFSKVKTAVKKAAQVVAKPAQAVKAAAKTIVQKAATLGLAIPRNAMLLLIRFNVHGWATGLKDKTFDELSWWKDIGGNRTDMQNAIKAGAKNKRVLGIEDGDIIHPQMMGMIGEPVTIAASLATAAPIIAKVQSILDTAEKASNAVEKVKTTVSQTKATVTKANDLFKAATGKSITDMVFKKEDGVTGKTNTISASDIGPVSDATANSIAQKLLGGGSTGNLLIFGGLAAAAVAAVAMSNSSNTRN